MYTVLLPPGVNPVAVNKYIVSLIVYVLVLWRKLAISTLYIAGENPNQIL
jgi:hypothetical protein